MVRQEFSQHLMEQHQTINRLKTKLSGVTEDHLISAFSQEITHKGQLIQNMFNKTIQEVNNGCVWQRAENFIDFYVRQADVIDPALPRSLSRMISRLESVQSQYVYSYSTTLYFYILIFLPILCFFLYIKTLNNRVIS